MKKGGRVILAITGASGAALGIRTLELLREAGKETHLIISAAAKKTIEYETGWSEAQVNSMASYCYEPDETDARLASGSFFTEGMIVVPCSIKSLSAIAHSYSNDLITRAADVSLKEGRKVILVVRETPLHSGHLRLMQQAAEAGAVIFPAIPVFYAGHETLEDVITDLCGRVLLRCGIENDAYSQWKNNEEDENQ